MSESISSRVGRMISGGFNSLLDAVEGVAAETIMEQSIREIEDGITEVRAEMGREIGSRHLASKKIAEKNQQHEALSENIALAITEGRDDLAEAAIARQLDIEVQIPVLEQSVIECSAKEKELEGYVLALQAKKREMEAELKSYRETFKVAVAGESCGVTVKGEAIDTKVSNAASTFERLMARKTGLKSGGDTTDKLTDIKIAELEALARKNRVKERLLAVKGQVKAGENS